MHGIYFVRGYEDGLRLKSNVEELISVELNFRLRDVRH
jgi:hypothetical protein